ncbi:MAG: phosphonate ABC transporter, permease protein PhnE [Bosea sp.]|nr:phosphonate ABC transporter, permease protein PhnE [Bosea sp. (in: a-proteobacteria)]
MSAVDTIDIDAVRARYPDVFAPQARRRLIPLAVVVAIIGYVAYAMWFFAIPQTLYTANWQRAGLYLAQWISYDIQVELRLRDGAVRVVWPRYSQLGSNPDPSWVTKAADGSVAVDVTGSGRLEASATTVTLRRGSETAVFDISGETPVAIGPVPDWVSVSEGDVEIDWGFWGRGEFDTDRIKLAKREPGWANFLFDTRSPFFGKSPAEVVSLIVAGPRLDPDRSNLSLALDDIWNNAEWQHGDVWTKLLQTIVMAFAGTLLAALVAFPLSFLAARNITHSWPLNQLLKRFFDFQRSIDMLIWALFFTRAFGPGPLAGTAAIFFTDTGTLGKLYAEALENIDDKPREGLHSVGAPAIAVQRFGVVPQILPVFASQALYFWESNARSATIIGAVGAGGIGLKLWEAMRTNTNWANVFYMVILILIMVYVFDAISNALRQRLIGSRI